ncbi:MAG: Translation initiation factor IF-1 [Parcubacteria group bacterium ADurb.Bin247]|jgi:translation initiation factor IF-1|nr:MAG: Translation initiation factor IF-1 [Parcubacteria group bacterium ADurb.Bin247]HQB85270.1 translation initiation factor IF-1 [Candidatus Pacearchaeota archaeon]
MDQKKGVIQKTGVIVEALPNAHFKVQLDDGGEVMAHLAGKMRMFRIRVMLGDKVTLEMSAPTDTRGRIVYRKK